MPSLLYPDLHSKMYLKSCGVIRSPQICRYLGNVCVVAKAPDPGVLANSFVLNRSLSIPATFRSKALPLALLFFLFLFFSGVKSKLSFKIFSPALL